MASVPLEIAEVFRPQATQVVAPAVLLHDTDLPAPDAAEPAVTVADEKRVVEYPRVHWTEVGGSVVAPVTLMFKVTDDPGLTEPELTPSVTPCPRQINEPVKRRKTICATLEP